MSTSIRDILCDSKTNKRNVSLFLFDNSLRSNWPWPVVFRANCRFLRNVSRTEQRSWRIWSQATPSNHRCSAAWRTKYRPLENISTTALHWPNAWGTKYQPLKNASLTALHWSAAWRTECRSLRKIVLSWSSETTKIRRPLSLTCQNLGDVSCRCRFWICQFVNNWNFKLIEIM